MTEKILLTVEEASNRLSVSRSKLYEMVRAGEIASISIGSARRIPVRVLEEFITRQLEMD